MQGYAPLSIRLVETALAQPNGWGPPGSSLMEAMAGLPGAAYDILQVNDGEKLNDGVLPQFKKQKL